MSRSRIHLALFVGTASTPVEPHDIAGGARTVKLEFPGHSPAEIAETIRVAELSPRDFRSNALIVTRPDIDPLVFAAAQSALSFLAGRAMPTQVDETITDVEDMEMRLHRERHTRPAQIDDMLQVGGTATDIPVVNIAGSAADIRTAINRIHFAKRVIVAALASPAAMTSVVSLVTAIRRRDGRDRPPFVSLGDEIVDLGAVHREVAALRRTSPGLAADLAPTIDLPERLQRFAEADSYPVEQILEILGTRRGPEGSNLWHCSRPERHSNGDQRPSMRVKNGKIRCLRCDEEPMGALRIVADTKHLSAEDAAEFILAHERQEPVSDTGTSDDG